MQTRYWCACLSLILITTGALPCDPLGATRSEAQSTPASTYWNAVARDLVRTDELDPVSASRAYAFVSIAQNDAVAAAQHAGGQGPDDGLAVIRDAVASSSVAVLSAFFPESGTQLKESYDRFAQAVDVATVGTITAGTTVGHAVAERVLARARGDGSDRDGEIVVPEGPGYWRRSPDRPPLRPHWGQVRPLLIDPVDAFVPEPPPALESAGFRAALAEVKSLSSGLDQKRGELVRFWADGPGTPTPAGHWNAIAAELVVRHNLSEQAAARTFALLNVALFDAGIACWKAKFAYWLARPNQLDPEIKPYIAVPNFPSYTSGHATFSGAAAEVLASLFPDEAESLRALAEEAAISRVYGGIHYPFDSETGLQMGRRIGRLAAALNPQPGELLPHLR
jgi:membrane-associated phospholipid phosphatase